MVRSSRARALCLAFTARVRPPCLRRLGIMLEDKTLLPVVDRTFALDDVVEAFEFMASGRASGKIVVNQMGSV